MFAVGLTRSTGGGTMVTPMASADDGYFDLCIVEGMSRGEFARDGAARSSAASTSDTKACTTSQLKAVTIEGREPIAVNVDGENEQRDAAHVSRAIARSVRPRGVHARRRRRERIAGARHQTKSPPRSLAAGFLLL